MDIGEVMKGRTMIYIAIILALLIISNIIIYKYAKTPDTKAIQAAVENERARIDAQWQESYNNVSRESIAKEKQIAELRKKYIRLTDEIKKKASEAEAIRQPQSAAETKTRFAALGYPPK